MPQYEKEEQKRSGRQSTLVSCFTVLLVKKGSVEVPWMFMVTDVSVVVTSHWYFSTN